MPLSGCILDDLIVSDEDIVVEDFPFLIQTMSKEQFINTLSQETQKIRSKRRAHHAYLMRSIHTIAVYGDIMNNPDKYLSTDSPKLFDLDMTQDEYFGLLYDQLLDRLDKGITEKSINAIAPQIKENGLIALKNHVLAKTAELDSVKSKLTSEKDKINATIGSLIFIAPKYYDADGSKYVISQVMNLGDKTVKAVKVNIHPSDFSKDGFSVLYDKPIEPDAKSVIALPAKEGYKSLALEVDFVEFSQGQKISVEEVNERLRQIEKQTRELAYKSKMIFDTIEEDELHFFDMKGL